MSEEKLEWSETPVLLKLRRKKFLKQTTINFDELKIEQWQKHQQISKDYLNVVKVYFIKVLFVKFLPEAYSGKAFA